jgi:ribosomal protein S18 acetylase RimI-like enzyme
MQLTFNITQTNSDAQLVEALPSLIDLYQQVFAEPPENQVWSPSQVREMLVSYKETGNLFVSFALDDKPIGFCATIPFTSSKVWNSQVSGALSTHLLNEDFLRDKFDINVFEVLYIADLVIDPRYRRQGLASQLMKTAIRDKKPVLLRVSLCREGAIALYKKLGFKPTNLFQTAKYKQLNGEVKTFEKTLMILT